MKGIFDTKTNSGYDDEITRRYHFPRRYLAAAESMVGDWIIYREPRRNDGRKGYVAIARVARIEPDPEQLDHAYAIVEDYLPFDHIVPFFDDGGYSESALKGISRGSVGSSLQGKSIRTIPQSDFVDIVDRGFGETLAPESAVSLGLDSQNIDQDTSDLINVPLPELVRRTRQILVNQKVRDRIFRRRICEAYDNRCALTGLRMLDDNGNPEVQAAHIWAVASGGPDVIQNGLALSGTIHWMFDRHLISLTDDHRFLVSSHRIPSGLLQLLPRPMDRIHLPQNQALWPHKDYIAQHRDLFNKADGGIFAGNVESPD